MLLFFFFLIQKILKFINTREIILFKIKNTVDKFENNQKSKQELYNLIDDIRIISCKIIQSILILRAELSDLINFEGKPNDFREFIQLTPFYYNGENYILKVYFKYKKLSILFFRLKYFIISIIFVVRC